MNINRIIKRQKGISLVELMCAIFVFSIATTAYFSLARKKHLVLSYSENKIKASSAAANKFEELRNAKFDELKKKWNKKRFHVSKLRNPAGGKSGVIKIEDYDKNIKKVTIMVYWEGADGNLRSVKITGLITKHGLK